MTNETRDLPLDVWGPTSKHYAGFSRVLPDLPGAALEIAPLVAHDRGRTIIPDINIESGYHVTAALPDLSYIRYRYQLQWKDVETADVEFVRSGQDALCRITYANNGSTPKTYITSLMNVLRREQQVHLDLPDGVTWIPAESYHAFDPADQATRYAIGDAYEGNETVKQLRLGKDGLRPGVCVSRYLVDQMGLGTVPAAARTKGVAANITFAFAPGTIIRYDIPEAAQATKKQVSLVIRYLMAGIERVTLALRSGSQEQRIELTPDDSHTDGCAFSPTVNVAGLAAGLELEVVALEQSGTVEAQLALDGILVVPAASGREEDYDAAWFNIAAAPPRFTWTRNAGQVGVLLESNQAPEARFYLESADERPVPPPPYSDATLTHVYHRELSGVAIDRKLSNDSLFNWYHVNCTITGDGADHFLGYNLGPFVLQPGEQRVVDVAICGDDRGLANAQSLRTRAGAVLQSAEATLAKARLQYETLDAAEAPSDYVAGVQTLRQYTLSNVTYPVRIGAELVRTYTPGRRWGGLFTWDSGMHGIGLAEYDPARACGILDQYLPRSGQDEVPVVLHGTPLPLHVYLLGEVYRLTQDAELIRRYFDRALLYWSYFAGLHPASSYDDGGIGMLCSYADGYNSQGVDDYPVQHYEGTMGLYGRVKTVSTTAHAIRTAKILQDLGAVIGEIRPELQARVDYLSQGLHAHSWDEQSTWFEHVFTETLTPVRAPEGESFNQGIDGVAPLVAGICTEAQHKALIGHIMSPDEMWTPHGIGVVSQSASYYRHDGYWNGKVWIPHQWFLWKAMISEGAFGHAINIARTALTTFDRAARDTYCSWELFDARSGMGQGCHHFGGLSAPLVAFHNALFRAGRFTPGYDTLVTADHPGQRTVHLRSPRAHRIRGLLCVPSGVQVTVSGAALTTAPLHQAGTTCVYPIALDADAADITW